MTMFERYGPALVTLHTALALVAVHFAVVVFVGGSPMGPEVYGPAVYAIPALVWAGAQIGGEALIAAGAAIRGRKGAVMVILGAVFVTPFYGYLGAAASLAGQGVIVTAACLYLTAPAAVIAAWLAIGELRNGRK